MRAIICLIILGLISYLPPSISLGAEAVEPLKFWHTQSEERGELLSQIIQEYNATNPSIPVEPAYQGSYDDIYRKTKAAVIAKTPPDLAVAYESMIADYYELGGVVDFQKFLDNPETALSPEEQKDIYPIFLESNKYPQFDDATLSFPFTKSLLVMFVNNDMLKQAGFNAPPQTWEEFEKQCMAMKAIGKKGYAMEYDASTLDGMFMSRGVDLIDEESGETNLDDPRVAEVLDMLRRLIKEGGAYEIDGMREEDVRDFVSQKCAFFIRSMTRRPVLQRDVAGAFEWSINPLPHAEGVDPVTVLYGANICVFPSSDARERAAWEFIKFFIQPEITARWAIGSGYLPVRQSARDLPLMQSWFREHPSNQKVVDMIPLGVTEPNVRGWQEVRDVMQEIALNAVIERGGKTPTDLAQELKAKADAIVFPEETERGIAARIFLTIIGLAIAGFLLMKLRRRQRGANVTGKDAL